MKNTKSPGSDYSSFIPVVFILIAVITFQLLIIPGQPLSAKGVADYSMTPPPDPETENKKEEERKAEADKRAKQDQQDQQRLQKEKEEKRLKDEEIRREQERREHERREREAREAQIREEQEREAQRQRDEAARIEAQRQEQDRLYREEQIRQEQDRVYKEQQARVEQEERDRIAYEEQQRQDQEARDAQDKQNQANDQNMNARPDDADSFVNPSEPNKKPLDTEDNTESRQRPAYYMHYKDTFFYPYDLYSSSHFSFDESDYVINQPKLSQKLPSWVRKGSANEAIYDISYAWKYKSLAHLIRHTTRRSVVSVFYNARPSHTLTQKHLYELTDEAFSNLDTYGMKFSSIKAKPTTLSFKLLHEFYTSDMRAKQVALIYSLKKINGVWLIQRIDIIRGGGI